VDEGCSVIIAVNKWDAVAEKKRTRYTNSNAPPRGDEVLDWAPIVTMSALTGQRTAKILPLAPKQTSSKFENPNVKAQQILRDAVTQPKGAARRLP